MRTKSGLLLLLLPLAMVMAGSTAQARPSASATVADDVRELGRSIEQMHPAPFRSVSKQKFQSEVSALARRAPTISRNEVLVGLLRIIALLGPRNGHTGLFPGDRLHSNLLHLYPVRLYQFTDGVFVVDAQNESLVRTRLVAVEGVPIDRVLELVRPLVPYDNESSLRGLTPHFVLTAEVLDGLGVVEGTGPADFTFERSSGERFDESLTALPGPQYAGVFADPHHGHNPSSLPYGTRPLYLAGGGKPLWARTLANGRAVYVGYNTVRLPAPAVLRKIERLVRAQGVRRVIVDVRLNGGGDNTTYSSLKTLFASKDVNRRGKLYLLIGRATFSAAANFAAEIDRDTRATIVGEPTGGGVETYADTFPVLLPTVGWNVYIAARYHERKQSKSDRRLAIEPDIRVGLASAQYFAGRDPVLERALKGL